MFTVWSVNSLLAKFYLWCSNTKEKPIILKPLWNGSFEYTPQKKSFGFLNLMFHIFSREFFTELFCYRFQGWIINPIQHLKSHKRIWMKRYSLHIVNIIMLCLCVKQTAKWVHPSGASRWISLFHSVRTRCEVLIIVAFYLPLVLSLTRLQLVQKKLDGHFNKRYH